MGDHKPTVLADERDIVDDQYVVRVVVLDVPVSQKCPEGIKYRMHFGTLDGETILRFDNSHGVDERHVFETVEEIDFPGVEELYRRFNRKLATHGID